MNSIIINSGTRNPMLNSIHSRCRNQIKIQLFERSLPCEARECDSLARDARVHRSEEIGAKREKKGRSKGEAAAEKRKSDISRCRESRSVYRLKYSEVEWEGERQTEWQREKEGRERQKYRQRTRERERVVMPAAKKQRKTKVEQQSLTPRHVSYLHLLRV